MPGRRGQPGWSCACQDHTRRPHDHQRLRRGGEHRGSVGHRPVAHVHVVRRHRIGDAHHHRIGADLVRLRGCQQPDVPAQHHRRWSDAHHLCRDGPARARGAYHRRVGHRRRHLLRLRGPPGGGCHHHRQGPADHHHLRLHRRWPGAAGEPRRPATGADGLPGIHRVALRCAVRQWVVARVRVRRRRVGALAHA